MVLLLTVPGLDCVYRQSLREPRRKFRILERAAGLTVLRLASFLPVRQTRCRKFCQSPVAQTEAEYLS
ncbi:hypothetical protein D3C80_1920930 [compost metagenome]